MLSLFTNYLKDNEIKVMDEEISKLNDKLRLLEDENRQLKDDKKQLEETADEYDKVVERLQADLETEKNRPRPGIATVDRAGLETLCHGSFGTFCNVADIGQALTVTGMFGKTLNNLELKLVLSKNISYDNLLQPAELLRPQEYPELAEAVGLAQAYPTFMFGQCQPITKNGCMHGLNFRPTKVDGKCSKVLVFITKTDKAVDTIKSYISKHSILENVSCNIFIETDGRCIFPIDIIDTMKAIQEENFIDGIGLSKATAPEWGKGNLYEDCLRRWGQHYPHVVFLP